MGGASVNDGSMLAGVDYGAVTDGEDDESTRSPGGDKSAPHPDTAIKVSVPPMLSVRAGVDGCGWVWMGVDGCGWVWMDV